MSPNRTGAITMLITTLVITISCQRESLLQTSTIPGAGGVSVARSG